MINEKSGEGLVRTRTLGEVIRFAESDPFGSFEKWPIKEIREACLKYIEASEFFDDYARGDWFESVIDDFSRKNDPVARDLASVYLFGAREKKTIIKAVKFVISLAEKHGMWSLNSTSKLIAGNLLDEGSSIELYDGMPFLPSYVTQLLERINRKEYYKDDWFCADRALRIVMAAKDCTFLAQIDKLIALLRKKEIKPTFFPVYAAGLHLAMLEETRKVLVKSAKKSRAE